MKKVLVRLNKLIDGAKGANRGRQPLESQHGPATGLAHVQTMANEKERNSKHTMLT
jgi:hypothetical protein